MITPKCQDIQSSRIPEVAQDAGMVRVLVGSYRGVEGPVDDIAIERGYLDIRFDLDGIFNTNSPLVRPRLFLSTRVF